MKSSGRSSEKVLADSEMQNATRIIGLSEITAPKMQPISLSTTNMGSEHVTMHKEGDDQVLAEDVSMSDK